MNPNFNTDTANQLIPGSESMQNHACFVWENYIMKAGFKNLLVIAHSAGGGCISAIMQKFSAHFFSSVK